MSGSEVGCPGGMGVGRSLSGIDAENLPIRAGPDCSVVMALRGISHEWNLGLTNAK
jgi:hypothetical protein